MRVDPAALRAASVQARQLSQELPKLADGVTASAQEAAASCAGFATAAALGQVAASWQARLAVVGGAFARTADTLTATADRDTATDHQVASVFDAAGPG